VDKGVVDEAEEVEPDAVDGLGEDGVVSTKEGEDEGQEVVSPGKWGGREGGRGRGGGRGAAASFDC